MDMNNHEELLELPKQELVKRLQQAYADLETKGADVLTDKIMSDMGFEIVPQKLEVVWNDGYGNLIKFSPERKIRFDVGVDFWKEIKVPNAVNNDLEEENKQLKDKLYFQKEVNENNECLIKELRVKLKQAEETAIDGEPVDKCEEIPFAEDVEAEVSPMPEPLEIAHTIVSNLAKEYEKRNINLYDEESQFFYEDLRKIAKHLLIEIGE